MVLETLWNYFRGTKRRLAESDLPVDAEHVQGGSKRFRNAESQPQSADRTYTTSQPISQRPPAAPLTPHNALPAPRNESIPVQHSKSLSSLDTNKRITIAPPTLAPSNFKFTYTASQSLPSATPSASATPQRPERKLKKNPNGPISYNGQWKSAKKQNRHASPAFQVPPRKPRVEAKDAYEVPADSKRRRVSVSVSEAAPPAQPATAGSTTAPARTSSSISPPKPSPLSSTSRLRTPAKPTTPARPSPLRQAWSNQPPTPPAHHSTHTTQAQTHSTHTQTQTHPAQPQTQTQTATLMAQLITQTEPPKRPDVSNPYQTANPVAGAIAPRRATRRTKKVLDRGALMKAKADAEAQALKAKEEANEGGTQQKGREAVEKGKEKEKEPYVSAQAQIEATLPPGSKRSRPPANLAQQQQQQASFPASLPASSQSSQSPPIVKSYVVEEAIDDVDEESSRSAKRAKPSVVAEPTIVDLDEVDSNKDKNTGKGRQTAEPSSSAATTTNSKPSVPGPGPATPSPFGGNLSRQPTMKSIPKEPSKLRNSFLPETVPSPPPTPAAGFTFAATTTASAAGVASTATTTTAGAGAGVGPSAPSPSPFFGSATSGFKATPPSSSTFTFKPTAVPFPSSTPTHSAAKDENMDTDTDDDDHAEVKARVRAVHEGTLPAYEFVFSSPALNTEREHVRGREDVKVLPAAALPAFVFDGGVKADSSDGGTSASGGFKFDLPRSYGSWPPKPLFGGPSSIPAAAAPSSTPSSSSPSSAPVHASAAPASTPAPPATTGFNWAAAGMKAPETNDKWVCMVCDVRNDNALRTCVACESDRPGGAVVSSSSSVPSSSSSLFGPSNPTPGDAPKPPAVPAVVGFNWAAAGMKAPDTSDKWVCAVCDVRNAQASTKCVSCESDRPGGVGSSSSSSSSSLPSSSMLFGSSKPAPVDAPKPPAVPAVVGFNWAAAGMKAPDTSDKWVCAVCDVRNAQASAKCEACESDRPGASASTSSSSSSSLFGSPAPASAPKPPAVPAVVGFNWTAAGMKAPDTSGKWTCSLCGLSNGQKSAQCETCETPR